MTAATDNRAYLRLLEAIKDSTEAIAGQPDSPAVARWLEHRAEAYRRLAAEHPRSEMADMARGAGDLDQARADKIRGGGGAHESDPGIPAGTLPGQLAAGQ